MQWKAAYKLGDKGVGKTSLLLRFVEGHFIAKQQSTIGAFFLTKRITSSSGTVCKMQLWDTAGQERFRAMAHMYYRGAAAAIVCFDITNENSFTKMKEWLWHNGRSFVEKKC
jgi:small GTP-binding protein